MEDSADPVRDAGVPIERRTTGQVVALAVCALLGLFIVVFAIAAKVQTSNDIKDLPDGYADARMLLTQSDFWASVLLMTGASLFVFAAIGVFTDSSQRRRAWTQFAIFAAFLLAGNASSLLAGNSWGYAVGLVALVIAAVIPSWIDARRTAR